MTIYRPPILISITLDQFQFNACATAVSEYNDDHKTSLTVEQHLQNFINKYTDSLVYKYLPAPTREEFLALQAENADLRRRLGE